MEAFCLGLLVPLGATGAFADHGGGILLLVAAGVLLTGRFTSLGFLETGKDSR